MTLSLLQFSKTPIHQPKLGQCIAVIKICCLAFVLLMRKNSPATISLLTFSPFLTQLNLSVTLFSKLKESCDCKRELSPIVDELGCCITVYHGAFRVVAEEADLPEELYTEYCDVDLPRDCNNSPLSDSVGIITLFLPLLQPLYWLFLLEVS